MPLDVGIVAVDPGRRKLLAARLKGRRGFRVVFQASSVEGALASLATGPVHFVVADFAGNGDTAPDDLVRVLGALAGEPRAEDEPGRATPPRWVVRGRRGPLPIGAAAGPSFGLTGREREVLGLLVQGCSYQNAATRLSLSTHTVHSHIRSVYRKLGVNSRGEAVYSALRRKLVPEM